MNVSEMTKIKNTNFNSVISALLSGEHMSIAEIAEKSSLSIPTVTKALEYGIKIEIVTPLEVAPSTGGRKPLLYAINNNYGYLISFVIDDEDLFYMITDYKDIACEAQSVRLKLSKTLQTMEIIIADAIAKYNNIVGVCFSLPATINKGVVQEWYYNRELNDFDFKGHFEQKFNIKCIVENDMKALASYCVEDCHYDSCAVVQFGHNGIGVSLVANGKVLRGNSGFAGEVCYMRDINAKIRSLRYCAKIITSIIIFTNPERIVFYSSYKQPNVDEIVRDATSGLPKHVRPIVVKRESSYVEDIMKGLVGLAKSLKEHIID